MSYKDVINIINAHYGWSMDAHEPEYKGEIKEKMQAMKQLVKELSIKAEAFDQIAEAHKPLEHRMSPVTIDEGLDFAEETEKIILKFYESGESDE